jgi:cytochrome c-type biogenesis protein CcmE
MGALRRWLARLSESDELRLDEELKAWAGSIPGTVRIADAAPRTRVRIAGMVRRITIRPVEGFEALEAVLTDGTGTITARWLGRRKIPGLLLGSRLVVEGVLGEEQGVRKIVNPTFEFLPAPH